MMATPQAPRDQTLGLLLAADLQDHLLTASNDLDRLQTLLSDACDILANSFFGARSQLDALADAEHVATREQINQHLVQAITALQFQDMASQLIVHTNKRLRNCADRLAADAFADDGEGEAVIETAPLRPNPVTQDEMDAGSVDLF
jgi:hypothetical protein